MNGKEMDKKNGAITFSDPRYYTNRELSWILFNKRVLSEARDKHIPLFERLKFLSITASNLDEFFMIRVASLKDMVHAGYTKPDIAGLNPSWHMPSVRAVEDAQRGDPRFGEPAVQYIQQIAVASAFVKRTPAHRTS